ncbi:MAG: acyltransferase family protein [Solirubrobacteraceae bacterium]
MRTAAQRFPLVDALRAIAAIAVLGTHAAFFAGAEGPGSLTGHFTMRLEVGVAIFFCISGFLLYRPFAAARHAGVPAPATGAYAWRRFLRIVPAYWLALVLSAWWLDRQDVFTANGLWTYFGFAQTWREPTIGGGLTQAWTLCIEVVFYAFLPVWAWLMRRTGRSLRAEVIGLSALFAISVAWKIAVLASGSQTQVRVTPELLALPAYLDQFALGMGLAVLSVWLADRPEPRWTRAADWSWALAAAAFVVVSVGIGIGNRLFEAMTPPQYFARHYLYALIGITMLAPAVIGTARGGPVRRLLANRTLAWLGLVSYGIYLWHDTVLALLARWHFDRIDVPHPFIAWPVAGLAGAAAIAAVSWYAVERPILSLRRLVPAGRRRQAPAIADGLAAAPRAD